MHRRRFMQAVGLAGATGPGLGLSGCVSAPVSTRALDCEGPAPPVGASDAPLAPPGGTDVDLPIAREALARGALRDEIPAITDPVFGADWGDVEQSLTDEDLVVGVTRDGRARAYPLATLSTYEVVNDDFGGPLLVTYCPLCASAVTAVRTVRNEPTVFGVSGLLYRANLVLYDRRTDSLWSQLLARSIRGPMTGETLRLVPSTLTTWREWRASHPATEVLLPPPASGTIDTVPEGMPSGVHGHVGVQDVALEYEDDRLARTALVTGVASQSAAVAYPRDRVAAAGVVNDCVGGLPVVVAGDNLPQAFDRRVDGEALWFERVEPNRLRAGGTTWSATTGRGLAGRLAGRTLRRAPGSATMYWFAWLDFHPGTAVYTR